MAGRLLIGFALAAAALLPAAASGAARDLAVHEISDVQPLGLPADVFAYSITVVDPPATPTFAWSVTAPAAYPKCKRFTTLAPTHEQQVDVLSYTSSIRIAIGAADGCAGTGRFFDGSVKVEIVMGTTTCSAALILGRRTAPRCIQGATGSSPAPPKPTTTVAAGGSTTTTTGSSAANRARDAALRQARIAVLQQRLLAARKNANTLAKRAASLPDVKTLKADARLIGHWSNRTAALAAGLAAAVASFAPPFAAIFGVESASLWATSDKLAQEAEDPPDPHYGTVARPQTSFHAVQAGGAAAAPLAAAVNRFDRDQARLGGLIDALRHAWERAQGAAIADDRAALHRQLSAAVLYATLAAKAYEPLAADLGRVRAALSAPAYAVGRADLRAAQARLRTGGFPPATRSTLAKAGLSKARIVALAKAASSVKLPADYRTVFAAPPLAAATRAASTHLLRFGGVAG